MERYDFDYLEGTLRERWAASTSLRAEFRNFPRYLAYMKAIKGGRIKPGRGG